jgi:hypothetical protein
MAAAIKVEALNAAYSAVKSAKHANDVARSLSLPMSIQAATEAAFIAIKKAYDLEVKAHNLLQNEKPIIDRIYRRTFATKMAQEAADEAYDNTIKKFKR